jgi:sodium-dependent dicarboxylate transporter 2/3/5
VALVALRVAGDRPARVVGSFMAVTAFISLWVSNTATAIMMLPVATSLIDLVERQMGGADGAGAAREGGSAATGAPAFGDPASPVRPFALALLLGMAYATSIGGVGTPIGTPPNLFLLSYLDEHLGRQISFVRWMAVGIPLVLVFLPLCWLLLTRLLFPVGFERIRGGRELVARALEDVGPMKAGERITLAVFLLASTLWVSQPILVDLEVAGHRPLSGLSDAGIAMLAALLLFVLPVDRRAGVFALDWRTAERLPFGVLILFGGGLSLAAALEANGVGELLGAQVAGFAGLPSLVVVLAVVTGVVFLSELTSNTATAATVVPILGALAPGLGLDPLLLVVPATFAASLAFMLPVGTPPNAVVFGTGRVGVSEMTRAGFWLNWIGIVLITALTYGIAMPLLAGG